MDRALEGRANGHANLIRGALGGDRGQVVWRSQCSGQEDADEQQGREGHARVCAGKVQAGDFRRHRSVHYLTRSPIVCREFRLKTCCSMN